MLLSGLDRFALATFGMWATCCLFGDVAILGVNILVLVELCIYTVYILWKIKRESEAWLETEVLASAVMRERRESKAWLETEILVDCRRLCRGFWQLLLLGFLPFAPRICAVCFRLCSVLVSVFYAFLVQFVFVAFFRASVLSVFFLGILFMLHVCFFSSVLCFIAFCIVDFVVYVFDEDDISFSYSITIACVLCRLICYRYAFWLFDLLSGRFCVHVQSLCVCFF